MITILIFACVFIIAILANFIRKNNNKRFYQLLEQFPSHPTYPLIGNAHMFVGSIESILRKMERYMEHYDRAVYWLGPKPLIFVKKCDDIVTILNQSNDRDELGALNEWIGLGLLTARHDEWKKSRRVLAPAFSSDMLAKYTRVFNKSASNLVETFKEAADNGEQIDVSDKVTNANLQTIVENAMGISIQNCGKEGDNFCYALFETIKEIIKRIQYPWLLSHHIYMIYLKLTRKIKTIEHLHHLPTKIFKENLNNNRGVRNEDNSTKNVDSSRTIIDLLIKKSSIEPGFDETRITDELLHMLMGGVETTSITVSFILLMMAMHQDVQQKAYDEITQLSTEDGRYTENHLTNNLKYLEQCIKETLRMFSPVVVTSRFTHKEITLTDNLTVPANVLVVALILLANKDPDLYKNPQRWDPEHFSDQAIEKRSKNSQLSFGYGARTCIGSKYAMMSIKTQIAYILRNYHLSTSVKELKREHLKADLSIRSRIGYPIKFTRRREMKQ